MLSCRSWARLTKTLSANLRAHHDLLKLNFYAPLCYEPSVYGISSNCCSSYASDSRRQTLSKRSSFEKAISKSTIWKPTFPASTNLNHTLRFTGNFNKSPPNIYSTSSIAARNLCTNNSKRPAIESKDKWENIYTVPNFLTVGRFVAAPFLGYMVCMEQYSSACALFLLAGFTDLIDGYIARNWPGKSEG